MRSIPVLPTQMFYLKQTSQWQKPDSWTIGKLLEVHHNLSPKLLKYCVDAVVNHHDALRSHFILDGADSTVSISKFKNQNEYFQYVDYSKLPPRDHASEIEERIKSIKDHMCLASGDVIKVVLFDLDENSPQRLLLLIHHLICDWVSFEIILEDLYSCYLQVAAGEREKLEICTASAIEAANKIHMYSNSDALLHELDHWSAFPWVEVENPELDDERGIEFDVKLTSVLSTLTRDETEYLMRTSFSKDNMSMLEILSFSVLEAMHSWLGGKWFCINLYSSGRFDLPAEYSLNLMRSVGNYAGPRFIPLERKEHADALEGLRDVQKQIAALPNNGQGLNYLVNGCTIPHVRKRLNDLEGVLPKAQHICINYAGIITSSGEENGMIKMANESIGPGRDPKDYPRGQLHCPVIISDRCLVYEWTYNSNVYNLETIHGLSEVFLSTLRNLIDCYKKEESTLKGCM